MSQSFEVLRTAYRVSDFLSWRRQDHLDLRPSFQRGSVWTPKSKSHFIDSVFRGYPVPLIFLKDSTNLKTYEPERIVVDGQQRLRTLIAYIDPTALGDASDADSFTVLKIHNSELAGKEFSALRDDQKQRILQFQLSTAVLPPSTDDRFILQLFARMNATGFKLTDQELRNSQYSGAFKTLAFELSSEHVDNLLKWGVITRNQAVRMVDSELTSELLMLLAVGITAKAQKQITKFYEEHDDELPAGHELAASHNQIMKLVAKVFDLNRPGNTQDIMPLQTLSWLYAIYAFIAEQSREAGGRVLPQSINLVSAQRLRLALEVSTTMLRRDAIEESLRKALRGAASDRASRLARVNFIHGAWNSTQ